MEDGDSSIRSKVRAGAALASRSKRPPSAKSDSPTRAAPSAFERRLRSHDGRIGILAEVVRELLEDDPAETRQRNLAAAMRGVKLAGEEVKNQELPEQIKALTAQLQADREDRARMESGVEFADEGAELPPLGGDECH